MTSDLVETLLEGPAGAWLRRFEAEPGEALQALLGGWASLGVLNAADPVTLLLDWLDVLGERDGFRSRVDSNLAAWMGQLWGDPAPKAMDESASLCAALWCNVASVIAGDRHLKESAEVLKWHVLEDRWFLDALTEGPSRDPQGLAWLALARYQTNRELLDDWWRLCSLPPDEPWYRGPYGIHGLRGLPAEPGQEGRPLPEVAEGLALLGASLHRRYEEGWLDEGIARDEFARTARLTRAAYRFDGNYWEPFWRREAQRKHRSLPDAWIGELVDLSRQRRHREPPEHEPLRWSQPDLLWSKKVQAVARRLERGEPSAVEDAQRLLEEQARYAEATGDTQFVAQSGGYLSSRVRKRRPELALAWASLARRYEPGNSHAWGNTAEALRSLRRAAEALQVAIERVLRFPEDPAARNGLAEVLRAEGRLAEAEGVYRETAARFRGDAVSRSGLAEVLRAQGRLGEAETVYRAAVEDFPNEAVPRSGLAEVLRTQGRLGEAETVYRAAVEDFPNEAVPRSGLAEVLRTQGRLGEAETVYRAAVEDFPNEAVPRSGLANVLRAQGRLAEAETVYRAAVEDFPNEAVPRSGLANVLRAQGRLAEAETVYRAAVEDFPNDVLARNGLVVVLRTAGRLAEAEAECLKTTKEFPRDSFAWCQLAGIRRARGCDEEAAWLYRKSLELDPRNEVARAGLEALLAEQPEPEPPEPGPERLEQPQDGAIPSRPAPPAAVVERASAREAEERHERPQSEPAPAGPEWREQLRDAGLEPLPPAPLTEAGEPVSAREGKGASEQPLSREDVERVVRDTYLLRRWGLAWRQEGETPGDLRERARELLQALQVCEQGSARAAGELGLLELAQDKAEGALAFLKEACRRFPGSVRVRYALGRAQRELARIQGRQLDAVAERDVTGPWREIARREAQLQPVALLGQARGYLVLRDGPEGSAKAEEAFGRLHKWVNRRIGSAAGAEDAVSADAPTGDPYRAQRVTPFRLWWPGQVQELLFGGVTSDALPPIDVLRDRATEHWRMLDVLEEESVLRIARV